MAVLLFASHSSARARHGRFNDEATGFVEKAWHSDDGR